MGTGTRETPLGAVIKGSIAAASGTAAMDAAGYIGYRKDGGQETLLRWEFGGITGWQQASAPGKVGKRLYEAWTGKTLGPQWAGLTSTMVHWGFGIQWGVVYGILAGSAPRARLWYGLPFGLGVWLVGYIILPLGGFYKPIWEYRPASLATDLWVHLVYGTATAAAFRALRRR